MKGWMLLRRAGLVPALIASAMVMGPVGGAAADTPPITSGAPQGIVPHHKGTAAMGQFPQFPQPSLQYYGGPVLRTNETFAIFWDPADGL